MTGSWEKVPFGDTGLRVSRIGLGSSYGLSDVEVERAYERGINFMFWGLRRRGSFGRGIAKIAARDREGVVIAVQSYTRVASLMSTSLDCVRRSLKVDHVDVLGLGWWDDLPPERILDAARKLKEQGKTRSIVISCHHRPSFEKMLQTPGLDGIMVRYNAAHPGAEQDVFPFLQPGAAVLGFTATRWATLMDPRFTPEGDATPRGSDCYRFALSSPHVHATLAGLRNGEELDEAMIALDRGPMSEDELAWMKRVGRAVRDKAKAQQVIGAFDRIRSALFGARRAA